MWLGRDLWDACNPHRRCTRRNEARGRCLADDEAQVTPERRISGAFSTSGRLLAGMQIALEHTMTHVPETTAAVTELDDIESLVRTYRPRLLRFVMYSIGDADLAESITQDCFLKAYNGRANFRGDCAINTWLTGIALNLIRDQQRLGKFRFWRQARATAIDVSEAADYLPIAESSPERRLLAREQTTRVQEAVETLSPNQRSVFLMRFQQEMDLAEIAATMSMPVNTVKTHLHRALKAVRAQVGAAQ